MQVPLFSDPICRSLFTDPICSSLFLLNFKPVHAPCDVINVLMFRVHVGGSSVCYCLCMVHAATLIYVFQIVRVYSVLVRQNLRVFQYLFLNTHSQQHTTVHIPYTQHTHTHTHIHKTHIYMYNTHIQHIHTQYTHTTHTHNTHTHTTHTAHTHTTHTHITHTHTTHTHNTHTCPCMHSTCFVLWIGTCLEPLFHSFRVLVYLSYNQCQGIIYLRSNFAKLNLS